jgi:hypothetical protein
LSGFFLAIRAKLDFEWLTMSPFFDLLALAIEPIIVKFFDIMVVRAYLYISDVVFMFL